MVHRKISIRTWIFNAKMTHASVEGNYTVPIQVGRESVGSYFMGGLYGNNLYF